jgi:copper homeostasis protein (lipoprotein)
MNPFRRSTILAFAVLLMVTACNRTKVEDDKSASKVLKGLYSYGPEIKTFSDCEEGKEYWVADSAKTLELYEPVYIEVECHMIKSDSLMIAADFDSTMVVTKVLKITKEIPDGPCN